MIINNGANENSCTYITVYMGKILYSTKENHYGIIGYVLFYFLKNIYLSEREHERERE